MNIFVCIFINHSLFFQFEANSNNWDVLHTYNYNINMFDDILLQEV